MRSTPCRRACAGLLAAALALGACSDDDTGTPASESTTTTTTTTTDPGDTTSTSRAEDAPDGVEGEVIEVAVSSGDVTGGGRHRVALGDTVTIQVTSDVTDHIHLHGYDVMVDVAAGETADVTFEATIPGVFEVELEDRGLLLVELEIS